MCSSSFQVRETTRSACAMVKYRYVHLQAKKWSSHSNPRLPKRTSRALLSTELVGREGKFLILFFFLPHPSLANVLTSSEYVNDIPTNPLMILSLLKTANNPANNIKQLPRNSRRTASHLWRQWKQCINYPHLKRTPWIKWSQFLSLALSSYIYCETKLHSTDTSITWT